MVMGAALCTLSLPTPAARAPKTLSPKPECPLAPQGLDSILADGGQDFPLVMPTLNLTSVLEKAHPLPGLSKLRQQAAPTAP